MNDDIIIDRSIEIFSSKPKVKQISFSRKVNTNHRFRECDYKDVAKLFRNNIVFDNEDFDITSAVLPMPISGTWEFFIATRKT